MNARAHSILCLTLVFATGCFYDPKPDIEEFRPAAEKQLAAIEKVGKAVAALPPLTADTMSFPTPSALDFGSNATVVHLEQITAPLDEPKIYDRIVSEEFFVAPMRLMKEGKDPYVSDLDKEKVTWRFRQLLDPRYLVVLKILKRTYPKSTGISTFSPGAIEGEAHLTELTESARTYGGFRWSVASSDTVSAKVRADHKNGDVYNALRSDMDSKATKLIREKLAAALPGAKPGKYW